jgi:hypothetical protein
VKIIRRIVGVSGACLLATAMVAGHAGADTPGTPETYAGTAAARGLVLNVLGQPATFGVSNAKVDSTLKAAADASGQLEQQQSVTTASVSTDGASSNQPKTCATPALPAQVAAIVDVGLACSQSAAAVQSGNPVASSSGSVASVDLKANTVLNQVESQLGIGDKLSQILAPLTGTPLDPVKTTVEDLVNSVLNTQTLSVQLGTSTSDVTTKAGTVTSTATAAGAVVKILPAPVVNGVPSVDPVATIEVSSAKATAAYDRTNGTSTPSFDAALVHVHLNTALQVVDFAVPVGQTQTILAGTPLESTITVANGSTVKNADGSVGAIADGVSLQLLKGLPGGGLTLQLAHAEAGVAGTPAVAPTVVQAVAQLPRTGGTPWIPFAGTGILALAFITRRTVVRARLAPEATSTGRQAS